MPPKKQRSPEVPQTPAVVDWKSPDVDSFLDELEAEVAEVREKRANRTPGLTPEGVQQLGHAPRPRKRKRKR